MQAPELQLHVTFNNLQILFLQTLHVRKRHFSIQTEWYVLQSPSIEWNSQNV